MDQPSLYREDAKEAVKIFRPLLIDLNVREGTGLLPIFIVNYDALDFLKLDEFSVQFAIGDIDAEGLFFVKYTRQKLLRAYIILNRNLYNSQGKWKREIRKIAAIHEFVHFIAVVYLANSIGSGSLRSKLLNRLRRTVDRLWGPDLLELYYALSGKKRKSNNIPPELTDSHFRLGDEGETPDYDILFYYFMFSRELFEAYFNQELQNQFKTLYAAQATRDQATHLLIDTLSYAANDKDVPFRVALEQLRNWVHVYMR